MWLVLALFGGFIGALADVISPDDGSQDGLLANARTEHLISQVSPITLFREGSTVLLDPEVRTTGLVDLEQVDRAIVSELDLGQSLGIVWPQLVLLFAMTAALFALAYVSFMRQEVRA